jgi:energy-coupling factor transporter ATP-binding protein EcfA2
MTKTASRVPDSVMQSSIAVRIDYFKNLFIAHPNIAKAQDDLMRTILSPGPYKIAMLYGPSGVGKTTLRQNITKKLTHYVQQHPADYRGRIAFPGILLDSPDDGRMSWRDDYYVPALGALNEILIDKKFEYEITPVNDPFTGVTTLHKHMRKADLRKTVITTLKWRNPIAFWIDDAQHLTKVSKGARLLDQIDSIKALSDATGVLHVLFGTYGMLNLLGLSAELLRRTIQIHLPRYQKDSKADFQAFEDTLYTLQMSLPIEEQPDLLAHSNYFYAQSQGCIGILKDRLTFALEAALKAGARTIMPEHWKAYETPEWELIEMSRQIREGERHLEAKMHPQNIIFPSVAPKQGKNNGVQPKPRRDSVGGEK